MLLIGSSFVLIAPVRELRMPWSKFYANQVTCACGDEPTVIEHVINCLALQPPRLSPRVTSDKARYVNKRALTLWLPVRGLEVPQQPVESFLIHVMHLPTPKVPNVPGIANQRWPARLQGHDRVVDSDRE
jgi:hypothetical protein